MSFYTNIFFVVIVFSVLGLSSCSTTSAPVGTEAYTAIEYKLAPGDQLRITVFGEDRFNAEYQVSSAGDLSFPLVGNVPVTGRTVASLQTDLEARLGDGYLNEPRVTVEVLNYRPFFILGEVDRPGKFDFEDDLTAVQAIALAGGFSYRADQRHVYIRRANDSQEREYDLRSARPIYIAPGDTIRIGERYF